DRGPDTAPRREPRRIAADPLRLPRRSRPGPGFAAHGPRGTAASARGARAAPPARAKPARAGGPALRGPPLDGWGERSVPRRDGRCSSRDTHAPRRHLPAGIPRAVDAERLLPAALAPSARSRGDRGIARQPPRPRPLARRPCRAHPRAGGREPLLHRGGRAVTVRGRRTRRRAGSLSAGEARGETRDPGERP